MRRSVLVALLAVAACGGGGAAAPDAGAADAGLEAILFQVRVPETTPAGSHIYVTGDFQGWNPAAPEDELHPTAAFTYELTLSFPAGTQLAYKITRGSWETVEKSSFGGEIANRTFEVLSAGTLDVTVGSWADTPLSTIVGDVTTTTVPGFLSGRRVWVYLPPGYHDGTARYPVLYMLDGQNVFDRFTSFAGEWKVDETLESLIPAGQVAPIIVVAVDNGGSARIAEYTPWPDPGNQPHGGAGDAQLGAIADVLVPWVNATYRTQTGPTHTGLAGSSLGGLMALYATWARPEVFGLNAALSPSIWWDGTMIVAYAASAAKKPPARVWMDMGTTEYDSAIPDLHAMRDAMVAEGFVVGTDLMIQEDPNGAHDEASWSRRFPGVVKFLFPPAAP